MKRYQVSFHARSTGGDITVGYGDDAKQAFEIARSYSEQGYSGLKIQDAQSGQSLEMSDFARQNGLK